MSHIYIIDESPKKKSSERIPKGYKLVEIEVADIDGNKKSGLVVWHVRQIEQLKNRK